MTDHLDRGLVEGPVWPLDKAGRHRRPFNETTSHGLGPHRARIHAFVPDAVDMRDQQFEFMTGRDMGLGTEWGNVKDLVSSSSSSSSSGRGGLKDSGIAITITPPVLHQSGDMVEVCVAQVPGADASTDFIAAYAPADVDLHATAPVKLKYLHEETSASLPASLYSSTGQGCVSFRLLNLRDAYSFAVMRGNVTSPLLLATSAAVGFKEPNEVASLNTTRLLLRALSSSISRPPLSLVLHIGDLSYARGYDYQWDEFLAQNEDIMKVVPWMVSSGNHERDASAVSLYRPSPSLYIGEDSGGECGVPTQIRFPMPGPWQEAEKDEPWYSFSSGPVRWVVLCIEKDFMPGSPQHDFLLDALSSQMNRTLTPWVVVAAHRPMYIDSDWDDPEKEASDQEVAKKMQEGLEDVLMQYKVDLGIYGHHHSYQRTCQVYRNKCLAPSGGTEYKAPVHAVVGMAGQGLSQNALAVRPAIFEHVDTSHFGLTLMTVNRTHLTLTLYSDEEGGEVLDTFTLLGKAGGEGGRASVVRTEG
ncbi:inactive purple acid phosphatase 27-like [Nannochloropsis oceanica]